MDNGYYWYTSSENDEGDLQEGKPQIVFVDGKTVDLMGTDVSYHIENFKGIFRKVEE